MRFFYDLTVPADTAAKSPAREDVGLFKGTLTQAGVYFRAGPHNQVSVVVLDKNLQFIPSAAGTAIIGNDKQFDIPMNYEIGSEPFDVTLLGWSPDTKYEHKVTFYFDIEPSEMSEKQAIQELLTILVPKGR